MISSPSSGVPVVVAAASAAGACREASPAAARVVDLDARLKEQVEVSQPFASAASPV